MTISKQHEKTQRKRPWKCHRNCPLQQLSFSLKLLFFLGLLQLQTQTVLSQEQQQQELQQQQQRNVQEQVEEEGVGDLASFTTEPFTPNVSHRQSVCDRYNGFSNGTLELRYALDGLELHPIIFFDDFLNYDYEKGLDKDDPGLLGALLDELAARAGFTWRNSFAALEPPFSTPVINNISWTFTDLLLWSVETYDVSVSWWDLSVERMERGVAYIEPWFDGSIILIDQVDPPLEAGINLFNWLRPFQPGVWILTILTIIASGCIHQLIEYLNGERNERSMWQWFQDNTYLSWLNFTQNYEYAPNSFSARIFGVSMGVWALVMTATYTANLASLLVEQNVVPETVDSIDQAIVKGIPICTYANTNADVLIKRRYKDAIRVPKSSELEAYEALRRGECGLVAGYNDNWLGYQKDRRYNPECDLEWVGRTVETIKSGFATKSDAGHLCSSFIRDVLNLHLVEMIRDNFLDEVWETYRDNAAGENVINCAADNEDSDTTGSRFLREEGQQHKHKQQYSSASSSPASSSPASYRHVPFRHTHNKSITKRRKLKGGGGGNLASANTLSDEGESLNIHQMAGVFFLHFVMMGVAVLVSVVERYLRIREEKQAAQAQTSSVAATEKFDDSGIDGSNGVLSSSSSSAAEDKRGRFMAAAAVPEAARTGGLGRQVSFRAHGPIIGSAPPVNTYIRNNNYGPNAFSSFNRIQPSMRGGFYNDNNYKNPETIQMQEMLVRNLQKTVHATQHELRDSHQEIRSEFRDSHQEIRNQMAVMMNMIQEIYKNNTGKESYFSGGGGVGTGSYGETPIIFGEAQEAIAAMSSVMDHNDDADKRHRD